MRRKLLAFDLEEIHSSPYKEILFQHKEIFGDFIKNFGGKIAIMGGSALEKLE